MSAIEANEEATDSSKSAFRKALMYELNINEKHISVDDIKTVRTVCELVGTQAARLSAVSIAAIMTQTCNVQNSGDDDQGVKVGIDGSVIEFKTLECPVTV